MGGQEVAVEVAATAAVVVATVVAAVAMAEGDEERVRGINGDEL